MAKAKKPVTAWLVVTESGTILHAASSKKLAHHCVRFGVNELYKKLGVRVVKAVEVVSKANK